MYLPFSSNAEEYLFISIYNWVPSLCGQLLQANVLNQILKQLVTYPSKQWLQFNLLLQIHRDKKNKIKCPEICFCQNINYESMKT